MKCHGSGAREEKVGAGLDDVEGFFSKESGEDTRERGGENMFLEGKPMMAMMMDGEKSSVTRKTGTMITH